MCRSLRLYFSSAGAPAVGVQWVGPPFCLVCSALILTWLIVISAEVSAGVAVGGAALCLACSNGRECRVDGVGGLMCSSAQT